MGIEDNIAGFQGTLGFTIGKKSKLIRDGLSVTASDADRNLLIKVRSLGDIEMEAFANGKSLGEATTISSADDYAEVLIPLNHNLAWGGTIESLEVSLRGAKGTLVEVDAIEVIR